MENGYFDDNKFLLIDTNAIYFISGFEKNEKLNYKNVTNYIKDKKIGISCYSIFEILNNKSFNSKYFDIFVELVKNCKEVSIFSLKELEFQIPINLLAKIKSTPEIKIRIKTEIGKNINRYMTDIYGQSLANSIMIHFAIFVHWKATINTNYSASFYVKYLSLFSNSLFKKIKPFLNKELNNLLEKDLYTEKKRDEIITNCFAYLTGTFADAYNKTLQSIDRKQFSYLAIKKRLDKILNKIKISSSIFKEHDYFDRTRTLFKTMTNLVPKIKTNVDKCLRCLSKKTSFFSDDELYLLHLCSSDLINKQIITGGRIKSNDFIDALIFIYFLQNDKITNFMTFDDNFFRKINTLSINNDKTKLGIITSNFFKNNKCV